MKKLLLVLLIAAVMVMSLGTVLEALSGISVYLGDTLLAPAQTLFGAILVGTVFVLLGALLAISVFSVICIVLASVFVALLVAGIGAAWPVLLIALVAYLIIRDKKTVQGC
ncbi:hypothetical protein [Lacimicrobium sp. SS2-24]|uniref:hypothetical protein n=1 Tax=Lacimicrobium sp. SS2-24 TaxID=2005569 RepID=UPI000B4C1790|nr:hypothetical protein [Lacimicrobium sp. SS2-24]